MRSCARDNGNTDETEREARIFQSSISGSGALPFFFRRRARDDRTSKSRLANAGAVHMPTRNEGSQGYAHHAAIIIIIIMAIKIRLMQMVTCVSCRQPFVVELFIRGVTRRFCRWWKNAE